MPSVTGANASGSSQTEQAPNDLHNALDLIVNANNVDSQKFGLALQTVNLALEGKTPTDITAFETQYQISPGTFLALLPSIDTSAASEDEDVHVGTITRIVKKLLARYLFDEIRAVYAEMIMQGLAHPSSHLRDLALFVLEKAPVEDLIQSEFFLPLIGCLSSESTSVGQRVEDVLFQIAHPLPGVEALFSAEAMSILTELLEESGTVKFRVYDLIIRVSAISPSHLRLCQESELLKSLIADLDDKADILRRLNVVQVFTTLAETDEGFQLLDNSGIIAQLVGIVSEDAHDDIEGILLVSAIIKFLGHVAAKTPETFIAASVKHSILEAMAKQLEGGREDVRMPIVIAIGNIGATSAGLRILVTQKTLLDAFLDMCRRAAGDAKVYIMESASCLIGAGAPQPGDIGEQLSDVAHGIFRAVAGQHHAVQALLRYARSAFLEPRIAALAIFKAMALHDWGHDEMNTNHDLVNFLTDRNETEATIKEWKFSVVQQFLAHPAASSRLNEVVRNRFVHHVRQGPFHRDVVPIVAFESA